MISDVVLNITIKMTRITNWKKEGPQRWTKEHSRSSRFVSEVDHFTEGYLVSVNSFENVCLTSAQTWKFFKHWLARDKALKSDLEKRNIALHLVLYLSHPLYYVLSALTAAL